ncbi:hypothetical protein [Actinacidiphila sp. bgisy160]|uniref:hypothetical protein n=1 Tax=Actinacidiphila sp. bgisy160 TaxID=3413796 RepID=UPI003D727CEE
MPDSTAGRRRRDGSAVGRSAVTVGAGLVPCAGSGIAGLPGGGRLVGGVVACAAPLLPVIARTKRS